MLNGKNKDLKHYFESIIFKSILQPVSTFLKGLHQVD
jgi:hypothetical protein